MKGNPERRSPALGGTHRPEYQLLLAACTGPRLLPQRQAEIADLLELPLDSRLFLLTAREQGVAALCCGQLTALGDAPLAAELLAELRGDATVAAARNLRLAAKVTEIIGLAETKRITLVPYKGAVLAEMAYGNLALREFVDVDFVLAQRQLRAAWSLLEGLGYRPLDPSLGDSPAAMPGEYAFLHARGGDRVELHTEFTLRHFPFQPDLAPLLAGCQPVQLLGRRVLSFSPEDTLTLLAVHGAKDFWSRLLWVCDVAWLVGRPGFEWAAALERAERLGCRRMVNLALLLASELLGAAIPDDAMAGARADAGARAQARWVAERLFTPRPMGRREQMRYRMRMVEGFWPGLRYAARLAATPAADDWNAVRLPAPLGFAYALLRPLRLLRR